jgi:hypothetical protein
MSREHQPYSVQSQGMQTLLHFHDLGAANKAQSCMRISQKYKNIKTYYYTRHPTYYQDYLCCANTDTDENKFEPEQIVVLPYSIKDLPNILVLTLMTILNYIEI